MGRAIIRLLRPRRQQALLRRRLDAVPRPRRCVGMSHDDSAIARMLAAARADLDRVEPQNLAAEVGAGAVVVDIRPAANRAAEGPMPGTIVIERIHLEWRLDPTSADRLDIASPDRRIIVVCDEGFSSSL